MKAVCVESDDYGKTLKGAVYQVAAVGYCKCYTWLAFEGVEWIWKATHCKCYACGHKAYDRQYFQARRFRPLLGSEQSELDAIEEEVSETELIPA